MPRTDLDDLSQLESEVELDMESDMADLEWDSPQSQETDDQEAPEDDEAFLELESDDDTALEAGSDAEDAQYVDRLMEIASREFESESEAEAALNEVLDDMSKEYFFGAIRRGFNKLKKNSIVRGLVKKGLKFAQGQFPALKAITQLTRGNLKGMLLNLGKQALGAAVPGSTAVMSALDNVGLQSESAEPADREVWDNYVRLSREAFETLADSLTEQADQPVEASRLASQALQSALSRAKTRQAAGASSGSRPRGGGGKDRVRRIRLQPGERVVISGAGRIFIKAR